MQPRGVGRGREQAPAASAAVSRLRRGSALAAKIGPSSRNRNGSAGSTCRMPMFRLLAVANPTSSAASGAATASSSSRSTPLRRQKGAAIASSSRIASGSFTPSATRL
jgi:hypothetical protein